MAKKQHHKENETIEEQTNQEFETTLARGKKFESLLSKMDKADQRSIQKALAKFEDNPASVKMKSLTMVSDSSTISLEINGLNVPLRVIGYLERRGNERCLTLFWAGTHPEYDKVVSKGFVVQQKLQGAESTLYKGLSLSDIANNSESYVIMKKADALNRIKNFDEQHGSQNNTKHKSHKYR